jgi:hypothetical protein
LKGRIKTWLFMLLFVAVCYLAACGVNLKATGILTGQVQIGPLVPVVGPGVIEPTPGPQLFAERKVVIFDASGTRQLQQIDILGDGTYRVELEVGIYVIDINRLGIDHGSGLPASVEILANQITTLDIDIDTGIR